MDRCGCRLDVPWVMGTWSPERHGDEAKADSFRSRREDAEEERDEMMGMETEGRRKEKGRGRLIC